jgi:hypothetical protein
MSLTAVEQLRIMSGEVKPASTDLQSLVLQNAFIYAENFITSHKVFDGELNVEAASYLNKMIAVCRNTMRDKNTLPVLTRMTVVRIGVVATDLNQVENATDAQWSGFIAGQMDEVFEAIALVRVDEKTAYDSL